MGFETVRPGGSGEGEILRIPEGMQNEVLWNGEFGMVGEADLGYTVNVFAFIFIRADIL